MGGLPPGEARSQDLDLWARIALRYPVAFSPVRTAIYHKDAGNHSSNRIITEETRYAGTIRRALETGSFIRTSEASLRRALDYHDTMIADQLIRAGMRSASRRFLASVVSKNRFRRLYLRMWLRSWLAPRSS